jgi:hypothetical protein
MKKVYMMLAVCAIALASCKKDYTCECCIDGICGEATAKMTKSDAEAWCEDSTNGVSGVTCKLK